VYTAKSGSLAFLYTNNGCVKKEIRKSVEEGAEGRNDPMYAHVNK
jgi:hypothetical protein